MHFCGVQICLADGAKCVVGLVWDVSAQRKGGLLSPGTCSEGYIYPEEGDGSVYIMLPTSRAIPLAEKSDWGT